MECLHLSREKAIKWQGMVPMEPGTSWMTGNVYHGKAKPQIIITVDNGILAP
jgi:hypothetical protein